MMVSRFVDGIDFSIRERLAESAHPPTVCVNHVRQAINSREDRAASVKALIPPRPAKGTILVMPASSPRLGQPVKLELRCTECGYGVVVTNPPEFCPICRSTSWTPVSARRASRDLH